MLKYQNRKICFLKVLFNYIAKSPFSTAMSWLRIYIDSEIVEEIEDYLSYKLQNCELRKIFSVNLI